MLQSRIAYIVCAIFIADILQVIYLFKLKYTNATDIETLD